MNTYSIHCAMVLVHVVMRLPATLYFVIVRLNVLAQAHCGSKYSVSWDYKINLKAEQ